LFSPLRYPGGKGLLSQYLTNIVNLNSLRGGTYYELYAGGAGAALNLLFNNIASRIVINDADYRIYSFWHSILYQTDQFISLIDRCEITIDEWHKQENIYKNTPTESLLNVGFATFFLNRTNRSGILHKAGPIGGMLQDGNYLMDARFNKLELKRRILAIAGRKEDIDLFNQTAEAFIQNLTIKQNSKSFFYLDPPYYNKGKDLYFNNYSHSQHVNLANLLKKNKLKNWLVSYDNTPEIRKMYTSFQKAAFNLNYSLQVKREGSELLIFSDNLKIPRTLQIRKKEQKLNVR
jgi:DNA adenine methylase